MMTQLQKSIIGDFKETYPQLSYREVSRLTGINVSRVFRIFNGMEMRLSEFERFQELAKDGESSLELLELARTCYKSLGRDHLSNLINEMKFNLECFSKKIS